MPRRRILLVGLAWTALSASCALAQQGRVADAPPARSRVDPHEAPWTSVGKLQAVAGSLRMTCTAAIVGERTVLTAAHCLYNARTGRDFSPSSLTFLVGFEGGRFVAATKGLEITIAPGFDRTDPGRTHGADWALVTLEGPAGPADRILRPEFVPPPTGTAILIGGYGRDNPLVLTADLSCRVLGYAVDGRGNRLMRHDCASTHGISGAPVLVRRADGGWAVAGVNVARSKTQPIGLATSLRPEAWPR